jgi:hypothetical protein
LRDQFGGSLGITSQRFQVSGVPGLFLLGDRLRFEGPPIFRRKYDRPKIGSRGCKLESNQKSPSG